MNKTNIMNVKELKLRNSGCFLLIIFSILINQVSYTQTNKFEEEGLRLLEEGRRDYINGRYCESINKYKEAEILLRASPINLAKLYIERSKSEYAINQDCETRKERDKEARTQITIRWIKMAIDIYCQIRDYVAQNRLLFPQGWLNIYDKFYNEYINRELQLDSFSLLFSGEEGETNPPPQFFKVRNLGKGVLNFQIHTDEKWIRVDRKSGEALNDWNEISVSVNIADLKMGNYQGTIAVFSDCARNSPQSITINLKILPPPIPKIELDKTSLLYELIKEKIIPNFQIFKIRNSSKGKLDYQIDFSEHWVIINPGKGHSYSEWQDITISVDVSNLPEGKNEYGGILTVTSTNAANSPQRIEVTIKRKPNIELNKQNLYFKLIKNEKDQDSSEVMIRSSIGGKLDFEISSDKEWLNVSPNVGTATSDWVSTKLTVDSSKIEEGEYGGTIIVSSAYAINSPQVINVQLKVTRKYIRPIKFTAGFYRGYYFPKDVIFKLIYGKKEEFWGGEFTFPLFLKGFDVQIDSKYIGFEGKSTFTEEGSKLRIIPFSVAIRLLANLDFLIPFVGPGVNYYIYSEEYTGGIYERIRGSTFGYNVRAGTYLKLQESFLLKIYITYNSVKAAEKKISINLGGIEYGLGVVFNF